MASNKIKDHLVTIEYLKKSKGSGVIIASHDRSDHYYILTARHNFTDELATSDEVQNEDLCIKLQNKVHLSPENLKVYFLDIKYDVALVIFKLKRSSETDNLKSLKLYNSDIEEDRKSIFYLAGYPDWQAKGDFDGNHDLIPAYTIDYNEDTCAEVLKDKGASTTHAIRYEEDHYKGISGGGVFFEDQYKNLQLRSIIKQYSSGSFSCTRLDELTDELNLKVEAYADEFSVSDLNHFETGDMIFAGDEPIEIDDITNFNYFKSSINERIGSSELWSTYKLEEYKLSDYEVDKESLKKVAKKLRDQRDRLKQETDDLSYFFAYMAIASHNIKEYRLSTNYFLEATRLNPKHTQTLLLEKHERKDRLKDIEASSLVDLKRKYELLLNESKNEAPIVRRQLLLDTINIARTFDDQNKSAVIKEYEGALIENYNDDHSLRDHHKYKELGDYFYSSKQQPDDVPTEALKYHSLSLKIAKLSPQTTTVVNFIEEFENTYNQLYNESTLDNYKDIVNESTLLAIAAVRAEEDPETKRILLRVSDEISELKAASTSQNRNTQDHTRILSSLSNELGSQVKHIHENSEKVDEANQNLLHLGKQTEGISKAVDSVSAKNISSQLIRIEGSALKIAQDLVSKLPDENKKNASTKTIKWLLYTIVTILLLTTPGNFPLN